MKQPLVNSSLIGFKISFLNKIYDVFKAIEKPWLSNQVTEKEVLYLLLMNPEYTLINLANKLNLSRKTIAERIKSLKEKGVIERFGSDNKGYWKINH